MDAYKFISELWNFGRQDVKLLRNVTVALTGSDNFGSHDTLLFLQNGRGSQFQSLILVAWRATLQNVVILSLRFL